MNEVIDTIEEVFEMRGRNQYGGEAVNQLEHALQCGGLAAEAEASQSLVLAAFLHDIGHILDEESGESNESGNLDDKHEHRGSGWLREHFGDAVADPVRLHVIAKRYLCTIDPHYKQQLSPTSLQSFYDQGGGMSENERLEFELERHYQEALRLRQWDDMAKIPDREAPPLEYFLSMAREALKKT